LKDFSNKSQPVFSGSQSQFRLATVFRRQAPHCRRVDVGRVAEDQVEPSRRRSEKIRPDEANAVLKAMPNDVLLRHLERRRRDIRGDDARIGERPRGEHREAARAGTQVEDPPRRVQVP